MKQKTQSGLACLLGGCALAAAMTASIPAAQAARRAGMRGVEHFGFTVPNAQQAVDFFVRVMGCKAFFTIGPFGPFKDDWMKQNLNVNPRAEIPVAHLVRCNRDQLRDLRVPRRQISAKGRRTAISADIIAFYVDDLQGRHGRHARQGVKFLGRPHLFSMDRSRGLTWIYFMAPWGMQLELVTAPEWPRPHEQTMSERLWDRASKRRARCAPSRAALAAALLCLSNYGLGPFPGFHGPYRTVVPRGDALEAYVQMPLALVLLPHDWKVGAGRSPHFLLAMPTVVSRSTCRRCIATKPCSPSGCERPAARRGLQQPHRRSHRYAGEARSIHPPASGGAQRRAGPGSQATQLDLADAVVSMHLRILLDCRTWPALARRQRVAIGRPRRQYRAPVPRGWQCRRAARASARSISHSTR